MLTNTGIELSAVIDPQLNWNKVSKGKSRAIRRARSSFLSTIKSKSVENVLKQSDNIINKQSRTREMSVSESEKLGVTILGRHFSDTIASVPIKKRRFLFQSSSPPLCSPSLTDVSELLEGSRVVSNQNGTAQNSERRHDKVDTSTAHLRVKGMRNVADGNYDLNDTEEELCEMADFSGISILAAAACSTATDDTMISESLVSKGDTFSPDGLFRFPESCSPEGNKVVEERLLDTADETLVRTATLLYTKEEDHTKLAGCHIHEASSSSLPNVPDKTTGNSVRVGPSLRDDRFHWDLNTVMDIWETPCDGIIAYSHPVASHAVGEDSSHHGGMGDKQEPYDVKIVVGDSVSAVQVMDKKVDFGRSSVDDRGRMDLVKSDSSCNSSVADHEGDSAGEQQEACCEPVAMADNTEETNALNNPEGCSFMAVVESFPAEHVLNPVSKCPSENSCASEEGEASTHGTVVSFAVEIKAGKNLHPNECSCTEHSILISEPHSTMDKRSGETATEEKMSAGSEALPHTHSDCCLADAQVSTTMEASELGCIFPQQHTGKSNECYSGPTAEQASGTLVCGDVYKMVSDGETHDDGGQTEDLIGTSNNDNQLTESGKCSIHELSDLKETQNWFMSKDEYLDAERTGFQGSRSMLNDPDRSSKSDHHVHTSSNILLVPSVTDKCALVGAPPDIQNGYSGNLVKGDLQKTLKGQFNGNCYSDASKNEKAVQIEFELEGANNSQYEDGEFIESFVCGWGTYVGDDFEVEHVDYGPDHKETDAFEGPEVCPAVSSFECDNKRLLEDGHCKENCDEKKESASSQFPSSVKSVSDIDTASRADGAVIKALRSRHSSRKGVKKMEKYTKDATEPSTLTGKVIQGGGFYSEDDTARESCHYACSRKKSSGWDQFPGGLRNPGDKVVDAGVGSSEINYDHIPSSGYGAGESLKMTGLTFRRKLSSQVERPKFNDISQRKERAYFQGTRNRNHYNDLHHNAERDAKLSRFDGRDGSSVHMHHKSRGDNWFQSSSHSSPYCHDAPGYYSATNFTHLGAKDATAVSIAKVVSNGFVVAPDGTVVEAGDVGLSSHLPQSSADSSLRSIRRTHRRGSPVKKDELVSLDRPLDLGSTRKMNPVRQISSFQGRRGRHGARLVSAERYYGFMPDHNIGSSLPVCHSFSHGKQSFSPQRRPVQLSKSHMISRSQSRTRSPHVWPSVRRTRSPPNFRFEPASERIKSSRKSGSVEHMAGFVPSSRNCGSPRHASRWIGERKIVTGHFREHESRSPRRGAPARMLSQSRRFDPVVSPEMLKQDKFYRPVHSGRFLELGVDMGPRLDGIDGDRRHGDRYEVFPSASQFHMLGDAKEDVFTLQKDCSEGARELRRRESPRSFHSREPSQHRSSPRELI